MITRMPPYNIFEELPKIANQVREISEDLGAELDFAFEAMQATFDHAIKKASTGEANGLVSVPHDLLMELRGVVVGEWAGAPLESDKAKYLHTLWTQIEAIRLATSSVQEALTRTILRRI